MGQSANPLDFDTSPPAPAPRGRVSTAWIKLWFTQFTATVCAILVVQAINLIVGWFLFTALLGKIQQVKEETTTEIRKSRG